MVGRKRSSLVRADDVRAAKSLHTRQVPDDRVLLRHFLRTQSEAGGDHGSQALRNGSNSECDCDLEIVDRALESSVMRRIPEVPDVDEPDEDADDGDHFCEHVPKVVQFAFERRLFGDLGRDGFVDVADGGALAGEDDDGAGGAVYDACSLEYEYTDICEFQNSGGRRIG